MSNHRCPSLPATSRGILTISAVIGSILVLTGVAGLGGEAFAATSKRAPKQQKATVQLQPSSAAPGATVSIVGGGFGTFQSTGVNRVLFGGIPALVQRWEPSLIEVRVPYEAKDGPVEIRKGKHKIAAGSFTVQRPIIREVVPAKAEPGEVVQLLGEHFGPTAGPRDPNSMFGVNDVVIGGVVVRSRRWRDDKIEVQVPANAASGDIHIRLASSDPLPDGSCCATVQHVLSNSVRISLMPAVRVDPLTGPIGTKVVLFGLGFGNGKGAGDAVLFNEHPAVVAQWKDSVIVAHVPLGAESGPVVLKTGGTARTLGHFTVTVPKVTKIKPERGPIGTLLRITGENFGYYSESGETPYAFADFEPGDNAVEIGGVPAVVYRWHQDRIDVWVPFSAKDGPVVVKRGAVKPNPDGSCCAERTVLTTEAGHFTVVTPQVTSYEPHSAGLDEVVTIKGTGFGDFLIMREAIQLGLSSQAYVGDRFQVGEDISRTEVLLNGVALHILSWSDNEIKIVVPRRHVFGVGKPGEFNPDLSKGTLMVRRGSWDVLPDGSCCQPKQYVTVPVGEFTVEHRGLPEQGMFKEHGMAPLGIKE
ncbi:MAG: IPT/TIG domain-containing protein [Nitrospiraceae bacterium]